MFAALTKKRTANYWFAVRQNKNAWQTIFLPGVFYYRAPWKMRTTKLLFAVRPKICARQRSKRTAIIVFPVVIIDNIYDTCCIYQIRTNIQVVNQVFVVPI
jgi:hypothetical protein